MADAGVGEAAVAEGGKTAAEAGTAAEVGGAAAAGAGAAEVGAGAAAGGTAMGGAAGVLGAADSAAASSALGYTAADVAGTGLEAGTAGGLFGVGGSLEAGGAGMGGLGRFAVSNAASQALKFMGSRGGLGTMQMLSGLYGLEESKKMRRGTGAPNPGDLTKMPGYQAGLEAVQRSMAAQGYQGSGNMMAALQKYGGDAYSQQWQNSIASQQAGMGGLIGSLSSLGLLTGGMGNLGSWGG